MVVGRKMCKVWYGREKVLIFNDVEGLRWGTGVRHMKALGF